MPTPLCTRCTRRSLSPCSNLNLIHYKDLPLFVALKPHVTEIMQIVKGKK
ncbi:hypothetical protein [Kingella kingae]|nr:hypothetical protein [Kingella kingae]MDK4537179.1 hypothetical protein [Kingella kingae]